MVLYALIFFYLNKAFEFDLILNGHFGIFFLIWFNVLIKIAFMTHDSWFQYMLLTKYKSKSKSNNLNPYILYIYLLYKYFLFVLGNNSTKSRDEVRN